MNWKKIKKGMLVDYHSIIGGPVTKPGCKVKYEPWTIGKPEVWVAMIEGVSGCVSCDALTPHKAEGEK